MWVLSLLASCFGQSSSDRRQQHAAAEYPRFPATDVADVAFQPVALDSGFVVKTFFLSLDKRRVYVLGEKPPGSDDPDLPPSRPRAGQRGQRLFALDATGTITHRLDLKRTDDGWGSSLGMIGDELLLFTGDHFVVLDPASVTERERIPVWH